MAERGTRQRTDSGGIGQPRDYGKRGTGYAGNREGDLSIGAMLHNYEPKPFGDYGTGGTQLDTPDWLSELSEFGYGKGYEGVGGGFADQDVSRAYGAEFRQLETLRSTISTENQNAMIQGQKGILDLEQSNANRALQFQTAMANQDFALFQLLIQEMQAGRDVYTQKHYG